MPIAKAECYFVECDKCGRNQDLGELAIPHFPTDSDAKGDAEDHDWAFYKDAVWCEKCTPLCVCGHYLDLHDIDEDDGDPFCSGGEGECPCEEFKPAWTISPAAK